MEYSSHGLALVRREDGLHGPVTVAYTFAGGALSRSGGDLRWTLGYLAAAEVLRKNAEAGREAREAQGFAEEAKMLADKL